MDDNNVDIAEIKKRVMDHLKSELFKKNMTVKDLAEIMNTDYSNLNKIFKSPKDHKTETIQEALKAIDLSICCFILKSKNTGKYTVCGESSLGLAYDSTKSPELPTF